eukprot:676532-Amphidinium_carterae.1
MALLSIVWRLQCLWPSAKLAIGAALANYVHIFAGPVSGAADLHLENSSPVHTRKGLRAMKQLASATVRKETLEEQTLLQFLASLACYSPNRKYYIYP